MLSVSSLNLSYKSMNLRGVMRTLEFVGRWSELKLALQTSKLASWGQSCGGDYILNLEFCQLPAYIQINTVWPRE